MDQSGRIPFLNLDMLDLWPMDGEQLSTEEITSSTSVDVEKDTRKSRLLEFGAVWVAKRPSSELVRRNCPAVSSYRAIHP